MIVVIDYGSGNLRSVSKAVESLGGDVIVSSDPEDIKKAERVILPGVGAYADCKRNLVERGLEQPVRDFIASGKPFLGICVGMQLLFSRGLEHGVTEGLGLIEGDVSEFFLDRSPKGEREGRLGREASVCAAQLVDVSDLLRSGL